MTSYQDPDYRGQELEEESLLLTECGQDGEEDSRPLKKKKSNVKESILSTFGEEDLVYFVSRVSTDVKELVKKTLETEEGKVLGVLIKMLDNRMAALSRRMCGMNKDVKEKVELLKQSYTDDKVGIDKCIGMMNWCYAYCKQCEKAGIYVMPKRF